MTDTTVTPMSPFEAVSQLADRLGGLRPIDRAVAISFLFGLRPDGLGDPFQPDFPAVADPFSTLVGSEAFGRELSVRLRGGEPNATRAFLHLLLDQDRLREVIAAAGLQSLFNTFDWD